MDFYEKPGCINGEKQKTILTRAGNELNCINILTFSWSREALLPFVEGKTPQQMMNWTAPDIKTGQIDPLSLGREEAIAMMVSNPILIKRPLICVDGLYIQGFDDQRLQPYLGDWDSGEDVTTCPNLKTVSCDEQRG